MKYDEQERLAELIFSRQIADTLRRASHFSLNEKTILLEALETYIVGIHPQIRGVTDRIIKAIKEIE